jgi:hypothetical protein
MNWERVESVRWWARSMFVIAGIAIAAAVLLPTTLPRGPTPMFEHTVHVAGIPASTLMMAIGIGGVIFGLAWMWRIYKSPTRYNDSALWRYRDR